MNKLIHKLVLLCLRKGYISDTQAPWLHYAIEKRATLFLVAIPFWLLGIYISTFEAATAFLFSFYFLRERTSGYHANNVWLCLVLSLASEVVFLGLLPKIESASFIVSVTLISAMYIFLFAPFRCPHMNLSNEEVIACRNSAKTRIILLLIIDILCSILGFKDVTFGISFGIVMAACGLAIAYINQKGDI